MLMRQGQPTSKRHDPPGSENKVMRASHRRYDADGFDGRCWAKLNLRFSLSSSVPNDAEAENALGDGGQQMRRPNLLLLASAWSPTAGVPWMIIVGRDHDCCGRNHPVAFCASGLIGNTLDRADG
jgi:hypothetical protein